MTVDYEKDAPRVLWSLIGVPRPEEGGRRPFPIGWFVLLATTVALVARALWGRLRRA